MQFLLPTVLVCSLNAGALGLDRRLPAAGASGEQRRLEPDLAKPPVRHYACVAGSCVLVRLLIVVYLGLFIPDDWLIISHYIGPVLFLLHSVLYYLYK